MTPRRPAPARISVVVVSRGRPACLRRCLEALGQVFWASVEVVVVADAAGRAIAVAHSWCRVVACDEANISAARNAGIAAAGGEILAFIDDDAVPEPMWLAAIADAFRDATVGAVTGPVLGRNGISQQSGAQTILTNATTVPAASDPAFRRAGAERAPKTVGTNMAFRANLLRDAGGFDERFRFYLDEADLNLRLGRMGVVTAYAPLATVHHWTSASPRRRGDRAPLDLTEIGRSTAMFLTRHHEGPYVATALSDARAREAARAHRGLVSGALEPRDVRRLLAGFDRGAVEGLAETSPRLARFGPRAEFHPRPLQPVRHVVIAGGPGRRAAARREAKRVRQTGAVVSLFLFSATTLYHKVRFENGIWVQSGGLWGRSERSGPLVCPGTRGSRLRAEIARISGVRGLDDQTVMLLPEDFDLSTEWTPSF